MRIAIVGTGISGLTTAYLLSREHDVVVYEANDRLGGHTATIDFEYQGKTYAVDTGFIVFNDWTYPNFKKLLSQIKVDYQPTSMGFSVSCEQTGLEYSGESLNTLFAQRRNIFRPSHWKMLIDILRFNKQAPLDLESGGEFTTMTLGEYLEKKKYSEIFVNKYLIPMGAAIWSASTSVMKAFPLQFFVKFFINHGLLSVSNRPQWHVIKGGSKSYLKPLTAPFIDTIRLAMPVTSIVRHESQEGHTGNVSIVAKDNTGIESTETFDHVVLACHSDQALALLSDVSQQERSILGSIGYRNNEVVLHTDNTLLPQCRETWSSWNYRIGSQSNGNDLPVLTYNMNILQNLRSDSTFCVTLNKTDAIDPDKILGVYQYAHPVFSVDAVAAQQRWGDINGPNHTWFCGAYWGNGFHEDGVNSAIRVAQSFGIEL